MWNIFIFVLGAAIMFGMGLKSTVSRRKLCSKGEKAEAMVSGTVHSRDGEAYVLEFTTAGGVHRLHYPKPAKGKGFAVGSKVVLHYDPEDPEKMFVEGDKSVLGAEVLYYCLGAVLLLLMAGIVQ